MKLCKAGVPFVVRVVGTIQQPTIDERWLYAAALEPDGLKRILRKHKTQNKFRWTPRHNYPKSLLQQTFCSTHEHEPTKEDGCLSVFKYMLLLALLVVVLSSCDTSEPSYTKQSFMNAKEHSNTETLFQRNAEAFSLRKLHSQTNS